MHTKPWKFNLSCIYLQILMSVLEVRIAVIQMLSAGTLRAASSVSVEKALRGMVIHAEVNMQIASTFC